MSIWAIRWRDSVVNAFQSEDVTALENLAKAAFKQTPSAIQLADSGAGFLLKDAFVWKICGDSAKGDAEAAFKKWRFTKYQHGDVRKVSGHPLGPLKAHGFAEARRHFNKFLGEIEFPYVNDKFQDEAAIQIARRGFENFRQLQGLSRSDVQGWSHSPGLRF